MARRSEPLFLEHRIYRRRRLADALRLLPLLGTGLVMLPLLGLPAGGSSTVRTGIYLFAVWALLIVLAAILSRALTASVEDPPPVPEAPGGTDDTGSGPGGAGAGG